MWISVNDKMPEHGDNVFIAGLNEDGEQGKTVARWSRSDNFWIVCDVMVDVVQGYFKTKDITHWMPIQDLP